MKRGPKSFLASSSRISSSISHSAMFSTLSSRACGSMSGRSRPASLRIARRPASSLPTLRSLPGSAIRSALISRMVILSISSPIATGARIAPPLFGIRHRLAYSIRVPVSTVRAEDSIADCMTHFDLPQRPKVLVVILRRLGDVLLATPLLRSLRRGLPGASLDVLVFAGSERILKGNPDIDRVLTMPERPSAGETLRLLAQLWRRYDLAVSTQSGDRPTFMASLAGRRRVGLVPPGGGWWKRVLHDLSVVADTDAHRVDELLRLADALS